MGLLTRLEDEIFDKDAEIAALRDKLAAAERELAEARKRMNKLAGIGSVRFVRPMNGHGWRIWAQEESGPGTVIEHFIGEGATPDAALDAARPKEAHE